MLDRCRQSERLFMDVILCSRHQFPNNLSESYRLFQQLCCWQYNKPPKLRGFLIAPGCLPSLRQLYYEVVQQVFHRLHVFILLPKRLFNPR